MKFTGKDHTYVICAYGDSSYLEECISSLIKQKVKSNIIMVTSTPSSFLNELSKKYRIQMYINKGENGISGDWNFGLSKVRTPIATIAHQDDIYEDWYTEEVLKYMNKSKKALIFFSDYGEIREGKRNKNNCLLRIKRIMLLPLRPRWTAENRFIRRRVLSLGSPISCPTVSYYLPNLPLPVFRNEYKSDLDWQAWEKLSCLKGEFLYSPQICMYHRIHEKSTTTELLQDNKRHWEDLEMFLKFWPKPIAYLLAWLYKNSEKSNWLR